MRRPEGYLTITDPDRPLVEVDTLLCNHCQRIVPVPPKADPSVLGGFCRACMKHICGPCTDRGVCVTWERQMEIMERREALVRAMSR